MANIGNRSGPAVLFSGHRNETGALSGVTGSIGFIQCLATNNTSRLSDGTFGRHMQVGVLRNNTEGSPAQPSLQLDIPGMWRFRWSVRSGSRTVQINCKQAANGTPRPTMIVKAATGILAADQTGTAGSSTGWVVISVSFVALADGALWVELWNNYYGLYATPTYFDHIVAT
jgi:hypothetical protein